MTAVAERGGTEVAPAVETVDVVIDGVSLSVPKGTLIIRAAELVGIQIPRFCDHPLLDPVGACRQCIVEVEGQRKPIASCTATVTDGMVVKTQQTSEIAEKAQRGTMELLLINHPLDCPVCDKGGECPLQNQAMSNGAAQSRFRDVKRTYPKPIAISTQVLLDRERCVLCARCTRFSLQVAGDPFIELFERGALEQVGISTDEPFQSYFSGNTVQICPVGALTGASYRFRARPFDLVSTPGVCEHCASGCAQRTDHRRGTVLRRLAGEDPAVNEEWNCDKGRWAFRYTTTDDRLTVPLVRDVDGAGRRALRPASWSEALERAAEGLLGRRVGLLPGGRLPVEDAYAWAKAARTVFRTNDVDARARVHSDEELAFLASQVAGRYAADGSAVSYADLDVAPAVLLVGFEPEEESPIVFLRLRKAARRGGLQVVSVAPFATPGLTKAFGRLVPAAPGTEAEVLDALAAGSEDLPLAAEVRELLSTRGALVLAGERLAGHPGALSAVVRLAGTTGARVAWVPRRAGERGAVEVGALPTLLPGGRVVSSQADRAEVAEVWGAPVPERPGRSTSQMLRACVDGDLDALLVGGVDVDDLPSPGLARDALRAASFVVSLEQRPTAVHEHADVVLPVAAAPERAGTFLDWEGRVRPFLGALESSGQLPDHRVLSALAEELDTDLLPAATATDTAASGALVATGADGTLMALRGEIERLGRGAGGGAAQPDVPVPDAPAPGPGQAVLASWHLLLDDGTLQTEEPHLAGTAKDARVHLSEATAAELGLRSGDRAAVTGPAGSVELPLAVVEMADRVVWLPAASSGVRPGRDLGASPGHVVEVSAPGAGRLAGDAGAVPASA